MIRSANVRTKNGVTNRPVTIKAVKPGPLQGQIPPFKPTTPPQKRKPALSSLSNAEDLH